MLYPSDSCSLMRQVNLSFLVHNAQYICYGRVIDLKSGWNEDSSLIFTTVRLATFESLKSKSPDTLTFQIPGGSVGPIGQRSTTEATFRLNEPVIVFIGPNLKLVGESQGKFTVQEDIALERGLPVEDFLKEVKMVLSDPSLGNFIPRSTDQRSFDYKITKYHWCSENPMGEFFNINANTLEVADEEAAIIASAMTWNSCGACFSFSYGGSSRTSMTSKDNENIIFWGKARLTYPVLAQTTFWYNTSTGCIQEIDCEFNDNESWLSNDADSYDIQTSMLHEFGHFLCLEHSEDSKSVMYPYYQGVRRSLTPDDVAGIMAMYGSCNSSGQPAWDSTYPLVLGASQNVELLKEYRDHILRPHPNGQYQIDRLYSQSKEILYILNSNPKMLLEARRLIGKNLTEVKSVVNHQKAVLQEPENILSFMENLASKGSLRTKFWLSSLKVKLERCRRTGQTFFGFQVRK